MAEAVRDVTKHEHLQERGIGAEVGALLQAALKKKLRTASA